jgi:hypothetical protein
MATDRAAARRSRALADHERMAFRTSIYVVV